MARPFLEPQHQARTFDRPAVAHRPQTEAAPPAIGLHEGGYLYLATPAGEGVLRENHAVQRAAGAHVALLVPDQLAARFPLAPFLGIMGVAAAGDVRLNSIQPGPHGGNLDITLLTEGATLYLPVQVPGALAYVGDPHFAQGDGEVALTALEASLRATIRFDVIPASDVAARFGDGLVIRARRGAVELDAAQDRPDARDHQPLDVGGTLVNLADAHITIDFGDAEFL